MSSLCFAPGIPFLLLLLLLLTSQISDSSNGCVMFVQVVTGGQYDVDVVLMSPTREVIYKQVRTQFDSHTFTPTVKGAYQVCFSNEFSTFSHKLVYMDFQVGDEPPLAGIWDYHVTVMTQVNDFGFNCSINHIFKTFFYTLLESNITGALFLFVDGVVCSRDT